MYNHKEYMRRYNRRLYVLDNKHTRRKTDPVHINYMRWYKSTPQQLWRNAIRHREMAYNIRAWVQAILGSMCELCGCTNPFMLTLDHKLNDGSKHRKQINGNAKKMYRAILKEGCPKSRYRLLCGSCNLAVSNFGEKTIIDSIRRKL